MDKDAKESIALGRYDIISVLKARKHEFPSEKKLFEYGATLPYIIDGEPHKPVSPYTIRRWYKACEKNGFNALMPGDRVDLGEFRKIDDDLQDTVLIFLKEHPGATAVSVHNRLIESGMISRSDVSLSTINRFVQKFRSNYAAKATIDRRRYERAHRNEVFYGDTVYGPYIETGKEKRRIYIIAVIDDSSRLVLGCQGFFHDDTASLYQVMGDVMSTYGIPDLFVFDNGRNYRSKQVKALAARCGTVIHYCAPYEPVQKGKIERFNRTLRDQFLSVLDHEDLKNLDSFNKALSVYIRKYNTSMHSSLGISPHEKYFSDDRMIKRLDPAVLEKALLMAEDRRVSADRIVQVNNILYEVPVGYSSRKVTIRYTPDKSRVWLEDSEEMIELSEVDKIENAYSGRIRMRRRSEEAKGMDPDEELWTEDEEEKS